jgi:hypothetical protein
VLFATSAVLLTVIVLAALTLCRFDHNDTDTISARQIEMKSNERVRARGMGNDGIGLLLKVSTHLRGREV